MGATCRFIKMLYREAHRRLSEMSCGFYFCVIGMSYRFICMTAVLPDDSALPRRYLVFDQAIIEVKIAGACPDSSSIKQSYKVPLKGVRELCFSE